MLKLMSKSYLINKKYTVIAFITCLFFAAIQLDGSKYYPAALLMCPTLLFNFIVGRQCYIEEQGDTYQFLQSLPITMKQLVNEKNILSYLCLMVGLLTVHIIGWIISILLKTTFTFDLNMIVIIGSTLLIYNSIFLILNYRFDYSKTQLTPYVLLVAMFLLIKYGNNFSSLIQNRAIPSILIIVIAINISIFHFAFDRVINK